MLSTLYLLVLAGIFLQGMIKISSNHIIQLNQLSSTYQLKTALNITEQFIENYIVDNNYEPPEKFQLSSSVGEIKGKKTFNDEYEIVIIHENGNLFEEIIKIERNQKNEVEQELSIQDNVERIKSLSEPE